MTEKNKVLHKLVRCYCFKCKEIYFEGTLESLDEAPDCPKDNQLLLFSEPDNSKKEEKENRVNESKVGN